MPLLIGLQQKQGGLSLLEMAIVLAIVGLLVAGLLPSLTSQMDQQRRHDTRKQMDEIKDALIGYAIVNGRLPCPAKASIATNIANAGVSDCSLTLGVVPWATLGTSETDGWGHRFTYSTTSSFVTANFLLTTAGDRIIKTAASGGTNVATSIPSVFISHGANGYGAYTSQGTQISVSSDADEADNSNTGTTFVSHDFSSTFDDLVAWVSPNILFNRMVTAGKLP